MECAYCNLHKPCKSGQPEPETRAFDTCKVIDLQFLIIQLVPYREGAGGSRLVALILLLTLSQDGGSCEGLAHSQLTYAQSMARSSILIDQLKFLKLSKIVLLNVVFFYLIVAWYLPNPICSPIR